jgi:hypothetical protein
MLPSFGIHVSLRQPKVNNKQPLVRGRVVNKEVIWLDISMQEVS